MSITFLSAAEKFSSPDGYQVVRPESNLPPVLPDDESVCELRMFKADGVCTAVPSTGIVCLGLFSTRKPREVSYDGNFKCIHVADERPGLGWVSAFFFLVYIWQLKYGPSLHQGFGIPTNFQSLKKEAVLGCVKLLWSFMKLLNKAVCDKISDVKKGLIYQWFFFDNQLLQVAFKVSHKLASVWSNISGRRMCFDRTLKGYINTHVFACRQRLDTHMR